MLIILIAIADATQFQGNAEHSGNFTSEAIIPRVEGKLSSAG
ncbi:MAG: hypothetical protein QXX76_00875 [Archaeoglobaceae archaeon]